MRSLGLGVVFVVLFMELGAAPARGDDPVARGRYLVEGVALCGECHTPRNADGSLDRARWLQGGPVVVERPGFVRDWAVVVPQIAGLPMYGESQAVRLLTEGVGREGKPLRPPMPRYRFSVPDAEAIASYLRSLR